MARPLYCQFHDTETADVIITMTGTGDTLVLCSECFQGFCTSMATADEPEAEALTEVIVDEVLQEENTPSVEEEEDDDQ